MNINRFNKKGVVLRTKACLFGVIALGCLGVSPLLSGTSEAALTSDVRANAHVVPAPPSPVVLQVAPDAAAPVMIAQAVNNPPTFTERDLTIYAFPGPRTLPNLTMATNVRDPAGGSLTVSLLNAGPAGLVSEISAYFLSSSEMTAPGNVGQVLVLGNATPHLRNGASALASAGNWTATVVVDNSAGARATVGMASINIEGDLNNPDDAIVLLAAPQGSSAFFVMASDESVIRDTVLRLRVGALSRYTNISVQLLNAPADLTDIVNDDSLFEGRPTLEFRDIARPDINAAVPLSQGGVQHELIVTARRAADRARSGSWAGQVSLGFQGNGFRSNLFVQLLEINVEAAPPAPVVPAVNLTATVSDTGLLTSGEDIAVPAAVTLATGACDLSAQTEDGADPCSVTPHNLSIRLANVRGAHFLRARPTLSVNANRDVVMSGGLARRDGVGLWRAEVLLTDGGIGGNAASFPLGTVSIQVLADLTYQETGIATRHATGPTSNVAGLSCPAGVSCRFQAYICNGDAPQNVPDLADICTSAGDVGAPARARLGVGEATVWWRIDVTSGSLLVREVFNVLPLVEFGGAPVLRVPVLAADSVEVELPFTAHIPGELAHTFSVIRVIQRESAISETPTSETLTLTAPNAALGTDRDQTVSVDVVTGQNLIRAVYRLVLPEGTSGDVFSRYYSRHSRREVTVAASIVTDEAARARADFAGASFELAYLPSFGPGETGTVDAQVHVVDFATHRMRFRATERRWHTLTTRPNLSDIPTDSVEVRYNGGDPLTISDLRFAGGVWSGDFTFTTAEASTHSDLLEILMRSNSGTPTYVNARQIWPVVVATALPLPAQLELDLRDDDFDGVLGDDGDTTLKFGDGDAGISVGGAQTLRLGAYALGRAAAVELSEIDARLDGADADGDFSLLDGVPQSVGFPPGYTGIGIADYQVSLRLGQRAAAVVIQYDEPLPTNPRAYQYHGPGVGWLPFVFTDIGVREADGDKVLSSPAPCPPPIVAPLDALQALGWRFPTGGDDCLLLNIRDGGDNDKDEQANYVVVDPLGVGVGRGGSRGFSPVGGSGGTGGTGGGGGGGGGAVGLISLTTMAVMGIMGALLASLLALVARRRPGRPVGA